MQHATVVTHLFPVQTYILTALQGKVFRAHNSPGETTQESSAQNQVKPWITEEALDVQLPAILSNPELQVS